MFILCYIINFYTKIYICHSVHITVGQNEHDQSLGFGMTASLSNDQTSDSEGETYMTVMPYKADGPGQISFEAGEMLNVLDKLIDGMK